MFDAGLGGGRAMMVFLSSNNMQVMLKA